MKFWNLISFVEDEQLIEAAQFCEQLGFEAVGMSDQAFLPAVNRCPYPESKDGQPFFTADKDWGFPDPWVALGVIAGATKTIRLMQSVLVLPYRHPLDVARSTGTLATLSNNRLYFCPAVGWQQQHFDAFGVDFATRGRRTDEMIEALRKIWTGEIVEHHGEFFDFEPLRMLPQPGHVPVIVSGPAEPVMRRAARLGDGWVDKGKYKLEQMPERIAAIHAMRREYGRDHLPFDILTIIRHEWQLDDYRRLEDMGVTGVQLPPVLYYLDRKHSTLDQKKAIWEEFAEKVIRHFPAPPQA